MWPQFLGDAFGLFGRMAGNGWERLFGSSTPEPSGDPGLDEARYYGSKVGEVAGGFAGGALGAAIGAPFGSSFATGAVGAGVGAYAGQTLGEHGGEVSYIGARVAQDILANPSDYTVDAAGAIIPATALAATNTLWQDPSFSPTPAWPGDPVPLTSIPGAGLQIDGAIPTPDNWPVNPNLSAIPYLGELQQYQQMVADPVFANLLQETVSSLNSTNQTISDLYDRYVPDQTTLSSDGANRGTGDYTGPTGAGGSFGGGGASGSWIEAFNDYGLSNAGLQAAGSTPGPVGSENGNVIGDWWTNSGAPDYGIPSYGGTNDGSVFSTGTAPYESYNGGSSASTTDEYNYSANADDNADYNPYFGNDFDGAPSDSYDVASSDGGDTGGGGGGGDGGYGGDDGGDSGGGGDGGAGGDGGGGGGAVAPIILDISGKGINITKLSSSNTFFDVTGDGYKNHTAWAGVGNGVLFVDMTGTGQLTQANQVVFTKWDPSAKSDMQALLDVFDTNHDGALDAADADFSKFFLMVTNADGTQTAHSLADLGITSINLNANATRVALDDGSSIDGETTFTMTSGGVTTTNLAATVTLAADANGYLVATTTTVNADGSTTIANVASAADGSLAYERILNTSADGLSRTLTNLNNGGGVATIQTDNMVVDGGSTTETVTNYAGGTIQSDGELTAGGTTGSEKLNATTTTTDGGVVTIQRDQLGGGWTTEQEVNTTNSDGSTSIVVSDLNPDGSASSVTTTDVSADDLTRKVTRLVDGVAADSSSSVDNTVVNGDTRTETRTGSVGTTGTSKITTITQTTSDSVTSTTTSDLTDGSTLNLTSVSSTVTNGDGSTTTTRTDSNADGSLRDVVVTQISADGLQKTTSTDLTGQMSAGAPVYDTITSDDTVINGDGSRTQTITTTSADGSQISKSVTTRAASGPARTVMVYGGDGTLAQSEAVTVDATSGATTDTLSSFNADGTLVNESVTTTSADGLSKTVQVDSTGATSGGLAVFDDTTTDVTTTSGGASTEIVTDYRASTSNLIDVTRTDVSADGLTRTVYSDFTGASGVADRAWDRISVDQTVVNADGSLIETKTLSDGAAHILSQTVRTTSSDRKRVTTTSTVGSTVEVETVAIQANGAVVDRIVNFDQDGDVLNGTVTTTSADGLVQTVQRDIQGQTAEAYAASGLSLDSTTTSATVINADGSTTRTVSDTSANGSLLDRVVTTTSANGLSKTIEEDSNGDGVIDQEVTDVTVLNADGSMTETVSNTSANGALESRLITITSANGLSVTTEEDGTGDGAFDASKTDVKTLNADGSETETISDYGPNGALADRIIKTTSAGGKTVTIDRSNGAGIVTQVETDVRETNGGEVETVSNYSNGALVNQSVTTIGADGLSVETQYRLSGSGPFIRTTTATTVLNADGSKTVTTTDRNAGGGLTDEAVVTVSANGLSKTTQEDTTGSGVFNLTITDVTVDNPDGSTTETITNTNASGAVVSETVTTMSADGTDIANSRDTTGNGVFNETQTRVVNADGSVVTTTSDFRPGGTLADRVVVTTSGNGLSITTQRDATGSGSFNETRDDVTVINADGSRNETISDFNAGNTLTDRTVITTSGIGLSRTTQWDLNGDGTIDESATDVTLLNADGSRTETTTYLSASGGTTSSQGVTTSADGLTRSVQWVSNGSGQSLTDVAGINGNLSQQSSTDVTVINADGSHTETVSYYEAGVLESRTIATTDGRTRTVQEDTNGDGTIDSSQTTVTTLNADGGKTQVVTDYTAGGAVKDSITATTSGDGRKVTISRAANGFGNIDQTQTDVTAIDGSKVEVITDYDPAGAVKDKTIVTTSADGLSKTTQWMLGAANLPNRTQTDVTVRNADGSMTETVTATNSDGSLYRQSILQTSADGRATTLQEKTAGHSYFNHTQTTTVNADGSSVTTDEDLASNGTVLDQTITTASADGLTKSVKEDTNGAGVYNYFATMQKNIDGTWVTDGYFVNASGGKLGRIVKVVDDDETTETEFNSDGSVKEMTVTVTDIDGDVTTSTVNGPDYPNQANGHYANAIRDPIVIDVAGTGLNLSALSASSTHFSWNATNFAQQTGWIGAGTGFLVVAPTDGSSITANDLVSSFDQLRSLDEDQNGLLNSSDPGFTSLEVWTDANGDGVAQASEVFTLAQLGIQSISLDNQSASQDANGNTVDTVSSVTMTDGSTHEIAAVAFDYSTSNTKYIGPDTPNAAAAALPQLHGYGNLPDLQKEMTGDPALLGLVQNFMQTPVTDSSGLGNAIANIMFNWAGVSNLDHWSRGAGIDARQLGFLEQFSGVSFLDAHGDIDPKYVWQLGELHQSWNTAFEGIAARLLLQGPMASAFPDFKFDPASDLITCNTSFRQALQDVVAQNSQSLWAALTILDAYVADWQQAADTTVSNIVPSTQEDYDAMLESASPLLTASTLAQLRSETFTGDAITPTSGRFTFSAGDGSLEIGFDAGGGNVPTATLVLGAGIEPAQLAASSDSQGNLFLTDGTSGDEIRIDGMMTPGAGGTNEFGVGSVQFADGVTWTAQQLINLADTASTTNQTLYGFEPIGTFTYDAGSGEVEINQDAGWSDVTAATLVLGPGISESELGVSSDRWGDLVLTDGVTGDQVTIDNQLNAGGDGQQEYGVAQVQFADGTTLTAQQLLTLANTASTTNQSLYGFQPNGKFVYDAGSGRVEIDQDAGQANVSTAILVLGPGISASTIGVSSDWSGSLILTDGVTGDQVRIDSQFYPGENGQQEYGVAQVQFADGTTLTAQQLLTLENTASSTHQMLFGFEPNNTFAYDAGTGQVEIYQDAGSWNASEAILELGPGISASQLDATTDSSGALVLTDGVAGDQIMLDSQISPGRHGQQEYGVAEVQFADGTVLTAQQLINVANTASLTNQRLFGRQPNGTFIDGPGTGQVEIDQDAGSWHVSAATLVLGSGISASALTVSSDASGALILTDSITGDQIKLDNQIRTGVGDEQEYGVAEVQFADGTILTAQQLINMADTVSPTNTTLFSYEPTGTFIYNAGSGQVEIDQESWWSVDTATLLLGPGITASDLGVTTDSSGALILTDGIAGDRIKLDNQTRAGINGQQEYGVAEVQFADGTALTAQQLINLAYTASPTNNGLFSFEPNTTFTYDVGVGQVEIGQDAGGNVNTATLVLGPGITASDLGASSDSSGDLILTDGVSGDQIKLDNQVLAAGGNGQLRYGVTQLQFADGTTWTARRLANLADTASPTNQTLYSFEPDATFTYDAGSGQVEINQDAGWFVSSTATLVLGPGITASSLTASSDSSGDLFLTDGMMGDRIKLDSQLRAGGGHGQQEYGVAQLQFADGTSWTAQQLANLADVASATNRTLFGFTPNSTFTYSAGTGQVEIDQDAGYFTTNAATLVLGPGISASDLVASSDSSGDLFMTDGVSGDEITLDNQLRVGGWSQLEHGVVRVQFADGTTWTAQQLANLADIASTTNQMLFGFAPSGTFTYSVGSGQVEIDQDSGWWNANTATLVLGPGISASTLRASSDAAGDLFLTDGVTGDQIKLDSQFRTGSNGELEYGVMQAQFADGTVLTTQQLANLADTASSTNQTLFGFAPTGTFTYAAGSGQVEINQDAGWNGVSAAILVLGPGISVAAVGASSDSSSDLLLTDGVTGDQVKLDNQIRVGWSGQQEYGVTQVQFADGTIWTPQQLVNLANTATSTNRSLHGYIPSETFTVNAGSGSVEISEDAGWNASTAATLMLGATSAQITAWSDNSGNLYIGDGVSGDQLKIDNMLNPGGGGAAEYGVAQVQFADGTSWSAQQLINLADTASVTNHTLYGSQRSNAFTYNPGSGAAEIKEDAGWTTNTTATLTLGATPAQITAWSDGSGNLFVGDGTAGDQIKIDNMLYPGGGGAAEYGVAQVQFADGTSWSAQQLISLADTASVTNHKLYGFRPDGTFTYNVGSGAAEIKEDAGWGTSTTAKLVLGLTPTQVTAWSDGSGNLYVGDGISGDQVKIDNLLNLGGGGAAEYGVAQVQFTDGTSWTAQQLIDLADVGSAANSTLHGFRTNGTFTYSAGAGHVEISEDGGWGTTSAAVLVLGAGIAASQVSVSYDSSGNVYVTDGINADQVKVDYMRNSAEYGVASIQFADGTSWTRAQILARSMVYGATTGANNLYGASGTNVFDGLGAPSGSQDYEQGAGGADTFIFKSGYGHVEINESTGYGHSSTATLLLSNINASQVVASSDSSGNIILTDGVSGDQVKIDNMLYLSGGAPAYGVGTAQFADGTTWAAQQMINLADTASAANPSLHGFRATGTFTYSAGSGHVEISQDGGYGTTSAAQLVFGTGVAASQMSVSNDSSNNVYLTDGVSADQIEIDYMWNDSSGRYGLGSVQFADGTSLTRAQILARSTVYGATTGANNLYGANGANVFDGLGAPSGSQDYEQGTGGADTFIFKSGYGHLEINESTGYGHSSTATLLLNNLNASQLIASSDSSGNIILTDGVGGDQVKVDNMLYLSGGAPAYGVGTVQFADGTTWTAQQLIDHADNGSAANPTLHGFRTTGTFTYSAGSGHVEISDDSGSGATSAAVLVLGSGIAASQVTLSNDSSGNIYLTDGISGDQVKIDNMWSSARYGVGSIQFADGTNWTRAQVLSDVSYKYQQGSGNLSIYNAVSGGTAPEGQLDFSSGLNEQKLWFVHSGSDLIIDILGTQNSITVQNWFGSNPSAQLQEIVGGDGLELDGQLNQLVAAMATFKTNNPGFDPTTATQMPSDATLQNTIGTAWHH